MSYENSSDESSNYGNDSLAKRVLNNLGKHDVVPVNTLEKWAEEILFRQEEYDNFLKDYAVNRDINQGNQELISRLSHPKKTAPVTVDPDLTFTPTISNKSREIAKDFDRRHFAAPKAPRDDLVYEETPTFTPQIDSRSKILAEIALAKRERSGRKLYDPKPILVKEEVPEESRKISSKGLENFLDRNSEWYNHQNEKKKERVLNSHIDAVERELEECTFQPHLISRSGPKQPKPKSAGADRKIKTATTQILFGENKSKNGQRKYSSVFEWKKSVVPENDISATNGRIYQDEGDLYAEDLESGNSNSVSLNSSGISLHSYDHRDFEASPDSTLNLNSLHISDQMPVQSSILVRSRSSDKPSSDPIPDPDKAVNNKSLALDMSKLGTSPISPDVPNLMPHRTQPKSLTKNISLAINTAAITKDASDEVTQLLTPHHDVMDLSPDEPKRGDVVAFENMQRNIVNTSSGRMLNLYLDNATIVKYKKLEEGSDDTPREAQSPSKPDAQKELPHQAPLPSPHRQKQDQTRQYEQSQQIYEQQQHQQQYAQNQDQMELYHMLQQQQMQQLQQLLAQQQQIQQLIQIHQEQMESTKKAKQQVQVAKPKSPNTPPQKTSKSTQKPSSPPKPTTPQKQKPSTPQKLSTPQKTSNSSRSCPQLSTTPKKPLSPPTKQPPQSQYPPSSQSKPVQFIDPQYHPIPPQPQHSPHYQPLLVPQHTEFQYHEPQFSQPIHSQQYSLPSPKNSTPQSFSLVDYYDSDGEEDSPVFHQPQIPTQPQFRPHTLTRSLELEMDSKEEELWGEIEREYIENNYRMNGVNFAEANTHYAPNSQTYQQSRTANVGTKQPTSKGPNNNPLRTLKKR